MEFLFALSGCSVNEQKNGAAENVHLHTPLGGLDVRTNSVNGADVGLPVYPGAVETGQHGDDSGSADIHMSFGEWHLTSKPLDTGAAIPKIRSSHFIKTPWHTTAMSSPARTRRRSGNPPNQPGTYLRQWSRVRSHHGRRSSKNHVSVSTPKISGDVKLLAGSLKINTSWSSIPPPTEQNFRWSRSSSASRSDRLGHHPARLRPDAD